MRLLLGLIFALPSGVMGAPPEIPCIGRAAHERGEIVVDTPWKQSVLDFTRKNLPHTAWGFSHSQRDYLLSLELAAHEALVIDCDVIFAAAFLHDMGGFAPYAKAGVDHALRSTQVLEEILEPTGFPMSKVNAVKAAVLTHSYYEKTSPVSAEAIVLHDADALDFLGAISAARILSLVQREPGVGSPADAIQLLERLLKQAPPALVAGPYSKALGVKREKELRDFLTALRAETAQGKTL